MRELRLVIFDVDGTLVDSQVMIYDAFRFAYERAGLSVPDRAIALSYVGMSLEKIFPALSPEQNDQTHAALIQGYRDAYFHIRQERGSNMLDSLKAEDWTLLAVATGKSTRGLDKLIEGHGLEGYFVSRQTADDHPSKPSPSMINAILAETGVAPDRAAMVGDTSFDMDMGQAAGSKTIGVSWGYHQVEMLKTDVIIDDFAALHRALDQLIGPAT